MIALSDAIADALLTTRWHTEWPNAAHGQHHYDASCAVCAGDLDALAAVAAKVATTQVRAEAAMELREDAEAHRRQAKARPVRAVVLRLRAHTIDMAAARITQGDQ